MHVREMGGVQASVYAHVQIGWSFEKYNRSG